MKYCLFSSRHGHIFKRLISTQFSVIYANPGVELKYFQEFDRRNRDKAYEPTGVH
jgi:hypothetical protein